jgi:hypothetical protein
VLTSWLEGGEKRQDQQQPGDQDQHRRQPAKRWQPFLIEHSLQLVVKEVDTCSGPERGERKQE